MKRIALTALVAAVAAASAAAQSPRSGETPAADPPLPNASKDELVDLRKRIVQVNRSLHPNAPRGTATEHDALLAEHDALLAAVDALGSCAPADHADLLKLYEHVFYGIGWRGDGDGEYSTRLARLANLCQRLRRLHPERDYRPTDNRIWAQSCLVADDLQQMKAAIDFAKARPGGDPLEHVHLQLLEARFYSQLGRLENATDLAAAAEKRFEEATQQQPTLSPRQVDGVRMELARTQADLALLCLSPERAEQAIAMLSPSAEKDLYEAYVGAMRRRPEAVVKLEALTQKTQGSTKRSALEKLVLLQLSLGDDDGALSSLQRLRAVAAPRAGDTEQRTVILQMELALRGKLPIDGALRQAGRDALDRLLQRWRAAPSLRGGTGFLHLDDRATLVQCLMRVEATLSPDEPATAALRTLLHVQAQSIGVNATPEVTAILPHFVGANRGLLVLVPGRFSSLAISFGAHGGELTQLGPGSELRSEGQTIRAKAAELLQQASPPTDSLAMLAKEGRSLLPELLRNQLERVENLTVCGAGMLDGLPFDLLPLGSDDVPAGLRHAIAYEENLVLGARRNPTRLVDGVAFLGSLRGTSADSEPKAMPVEAVDACLAVYPKPFVLYDHKATPVTARSALTTFGIVHFVVHGRYTSDRLDPNGLAFGNGPDEGLFAADIDGCNLRGAIVLLGACEVGNNPYRRGGDPMAPSIVGAMLEAGARSVLTATTEIEMFRHLESMAVVHRVLKSGRPIAQAVLQARKEARSTSAQIEMLLMRLLGRGD